MNTICESYPLEALATVVNGYSFKSGDFSSDNDIQSIKITNVGVQEFIEETDSLLPFAYREQFPRYLAEAGDIAIALTRTLIKSGLKVAIIPPKFDGSLINQRVAVIKPDSKVLDKRFLYYYLTSQAAYDYVKASVNELMQPNLSIKDLKSFAIPALALPEQKRIVAILDQAFADIEQARAKTEQNLKNAHELFESYLQQVFSQRGEGWAEKKWGDVCKFVRGPFGGSLKKSMFKEEGFAVYEQKHAIHDHIEQLRYFVDDQKFEEMRRFEVKPGELIMSCSGVTLGRVSVIPEGAPQGIINQALLKLTPNEDINVHFLKYWVRSKIFQDIIFEHAGGAAIPNVPAAKILKEIILLIPSIDEQNAVVNEIDLILLETNKVADIYRTKIESLDELKKSILQKAFSGELSKTPDNETSKGAAV